MARHDKKERHRLKRKARQREHRRAASVTPLRQLAAGNGSLECYVNTDWRDGGMAMVYVLGTTPGGRCAVGAFLVDAWCVGLKDAFGMAEYLAADFHDELLPRIRGEYAMAKVDPSVARRVVAAGARFARRNGFRLPEHWERWAAIFAPAGGLGDLASADLEGFGIDGGARLRYVGTPRFLRERMIGQAPEAFLARDDVEWRWGDGRLRSKDDLFSPASSDFDPVLDMTDDDGDSEDDEDVEELAEEMLDALEPTMLKLEQAVRRWCEARGTRAHPQLAEALGLMMIAMLPAAVPDPDAPDPVEAAADEAVEDLAIDPGAMDLGKQTIGAMLGATPPPRREGLEEAMAQVSAFMKSFPNPQAMLDSVNAPPGA